MTVRLAGPSTAALAGPLDLPLLGRRARRVLRELAHGRSELSVSLVGDAEIAALNGAYRGRSRPTDVLSFSLLEGDHHVHRGALLGDVVIGIETARRQARARHRAVDEEVARLLVHGVLHLLGFDHEDAVDARKMRREERRLWQAIRP